MSFKELSFDSPVSVSWQSLCILYSDKEFKGLSGSTIFKGSLSDYSFELKAKKTAKKQEKKVPEKKTEKLYSINKTKLRSKINSFFHLRTTQKFCAFYTISFPLNFPDKSAMKVLNNCLTNMRVRYQAFDYIFVAERQKNGTIHFHMLVNRFFNVRIINHLFGNAILNEIQKNSLFHLNFNKQKYNGVDVKYIRNSKNLKGYLTKYVSKNDEYFVTRPWGCSHSVSALFTKFSATLFEVRDKLQLIQTKSGEYLRKCDKFFSTYPLKFTINQSVARYLINANNLISENFYTNFDIFKPLTPIMQAISEPCFTPKQLELF